MDEKDSDVDHHESDTDSESDFDPSEYEKKKDEYLRKVVLAEFHYQEVRRILRDKRYQEVALKKKLLKSETCPEFIKKRNEILRKADKRKLECRAIYELRREALNNDIDARRKYVQTEQDDNYYVLQQRLIDTIKEIITRKIKAENDVLMYIEMTSALPSRSNKKRGGKLSEEHFIKTFSEHGVNYKIMEDPAMSIFRCAGRDKVAIPLESEEGRNVEVTTKRIPSKRLDGAQKV